MGEGGFLLLPLFFVHYNVIIRHCRPFAISNGGYMAPKIGLFPLGLVLFPGATAKLHIFEPRYKALIAHCLERKLGFGINLVDEQQMYQTGCLVEVSEIFRKYPDGRYDLAVSGRQRYRLNTMSDEEEQYYIGEVEFFEDEPEFLDRDLQTKCIRLYDDLMRIVYKNAADKLVLEGIEADVVSFIIAQKAGIDLQTKQEVLEMRSENERLQLLYDFLHKTMPKLRKSSKIDDLIKNNGYLPPNFRP